MAMFAAAFIAMRSVRMFPSFSSPAEAVPAPTIIRFEPPAPKPIPKAIPRATTAAPNPAPVVAPATVPTGVAPAIPQPAAGVAAPADSATTSRSRIGDIPALPKGLTPPAPITDARGAVINRAGVVAPFRPLSDAERDSISDVMMRAMMAEVHRPLTKEEREAMRDRIEPGRAPRNSRAGSDGKVVPLMNGGYSVAVPILSFSVGGKSAAERKREAAIDSVNRTILFRLQERAHLLRDSVRADSLRRDSLAKRIRP
jgi:hypothetical protein